MNDQQINDFTNAIGNLAQNVANQAVQAQAPAPPRDGNRKPDYFSSCDVEDWFTWRHLFEAVVVINGWDVARSRVEAYHCMKGRANMNIRHIPYAVPPPAAPGAAADVVAAANAAIAAATLQQLLDAYEEAFCPATGGADAEERLRVAKQRDNETLLDWSCRLKVLYRRAHRHLAEADMDQGRLMTKAFIRGLRSGDVRVHLLSTIQPDYTTAYNNACLRLAAVSQKGNGASLNALGRRDRDRSSNRGGAPKGNCFNCDAPGHFSKDCTKPIRAGASSYRGANRGRGSSGRSRGGRGRGRGSSGGARGGARHRLSAIQPTDDDDYVDPEATTEEDDEASGNY